MIKINEADEFTATVPVANNAEFCSHGERLATAQALANRTKNLNGRLASVEAITVVGTGKLLKFTDSLSSLADLVLPDKLGLNNVIKTMGEGLAAWTKYAIDRLPGVSLDDQTQSHPPVVIGALGATWTFTDASSVPFISQAVLDSGRLYLAMPLPRWGYLKAVSVTILPDSAHAALPAVKPRLCVGRILVDIIDGSNDYSEIAAADDSSANTTAYHVTHQISLSGLSVPLTATPYKQFYLKFTGESGANSVLGLKVIGVTVTIGGAP